MLVAVMCALFTGQACATDYSYTFSAKVYEAAGAQTLGTVSWTMSGTGGSYFGYDATKGQQFGSGSKPYSAVSLSTSGISGTISSIVVNTSGAKDINATVAVSVGSTAFKCGGNTTTSISATATAYTFTGSAAGNITISWANSSSKAIYIKSIVVTYTTGSSKPDCVEASSITLAPGNFDIKGNTSGTFVADGTKADEGATFTYSTTALSGLTVASDGSYTASAAGSYTVKVTATPSDSENYSSVEKNFNITLTDTRDACGLAYTPSSYDANLGESFTTPTLTNPNSLSVTYSSSPTSVATVDPSTGAVTLIKEGEVTITATFAGNDNYKGGTATYTITITDPNKKVFDFESKANDYGSGVTTTSNSDTYIETEKTWTLDGVTIVTAGKYRWWNSDGTLRFYSTTPSQSKMTISAPTGKVITNIALTGGQQFTSNDGAYSSSNGKWAGQATSVVLTYAKASGSINVKTVSVTIGDPTVTVGSALYTTYTTLIPVSFAGVTAYTVSSISGSAVSLTEVTEAPANTPVIIKAAAADTYTLTYKSGAASVGTNLLQASDGTVTGDASTIYALGKKSDVVGFYLVNTGVTVPAGKAYLTVGGGSVKEFLTFDFDADAINTVQGSGFKVQDSEIFNLAGQKMNRLQKGINIVNGKKVFVK